jgi:hypothetical protein
MGVKKISIYATQGQFMMVLLASLVDLSERIPSKEEVERHVEKCGYLKLSPELAKESYDSKAEPKWKTRLAYARRDAVDKGFLKRLAVRNAWEISDKGLERFARLEQQFRTGKCDPKGFEFLSASFLERMGLTANS